MTEVGVGEEFSELRDLLGAFIRVRIYTQICYCFPLQDTSSLPQIVDTLNQGYARLHTDLSWLTGQITIQPATETRCKGPIVKNTGLKPSIRINDLTVPKEGSPQTPSFDRLQAAGFPFHLLDDVLLAPPESNGFTYDDNQNPATVFLVQLNIIPGGVIITISGEHSQMDGHGVAQVTKLLCKACQNIPLTHQEIQESNRPRLDSIPLLDTRTDLSTPELSRYVLQSGSHRLVSPATPEMDPKWAYISFSGPSLSNLKHHANETKVPGTPYITTNDALSALLWQATSRVRSQRLPDSTNSTFVRAVDMRPFLDISPLYMSNMGIATYSSSALSALSTVPVGQIASVLRKDLNPEHLVSRLRALASYIATHHDDLSPLSPAVGIDLSKDIWFSSWARLPCYDFDFGLHHLLGKPEKVRMTGLGAFEGLAYFMPMDREGGIDAVVCLRKSDLALLRQDAEFMKWGTWIG